LRIYVTVTCTVTVLVILPLFASTVIEYVPAAVFDPAVIVNVEVPDVAIELGLNVADNPGTSEIPSKVKFTVPLKFSGVTPRSKVTDFPPGLVVNAAVLTVIQKSVPVGVRLHADPGLPEGCLKLEFVSCPVTLCQPEKSSVSPFFGVGTI